LNYFSSKFLHIYLINIGLLCIAGCADSRVKAESEAVNVGFLNRNIKTESFNIFASTKINGEANDKIIFYIEGDGHAWKRKNKLSDDPTPKNPVSLNLALNDSDSNVVYLARPCQYLEKAQLENCNSRYWSSHRYSEEVVIAMDQAITEIKSFSSAKNIDLVGYSGGGVVAMLVAAKRDDVQRVITLASNIDHETWSEWHGISKLSGSLSPMGFLKDLKTVKQLHIWGGKDKIVPFESQAMFVEQNTKNALFEYEIIPDFTHDCCWIDFWQNSAIHK